MDNFSRELNLKEISKGLEILTKIVKLNLLSDKQVSKFDFNKFLNLYNKTNQNDEVKYLVLVCIEAFDESFDLSNVSSFVENLEFFLKISEHHYSNDSLRFKKVGLTLL